MRFPRTQGSAEHRVTQLLQDAGLVFMVVFDDPNEWNNRAWLLTFVGDIELLLSLDEDLEGLYAEAVSSQAPAEVPDFVAVGSEAGPKPYWAASSIDTEDLDAEQLHEFLYDVAGVFMHG